MTDGNLARVGRMYSRWRPDTGGYDYFESTERVGLGDDLAVPNLPMGTAIGVASTDIGRKPTGQLTPRGSGQVAVGGVMPLSREGLSGAGSVLESFPWWVTAGLIGAAIGVAVYELRRSA